MVEKTDGKKEKKYAFFYDKKVSFKKKDKLDISQ